MHRIAWSKLSDISCQILNKKDLAGRTFFMKKSFAGRRSCFCSQKQKSKHLLVKYVFQNLENLDKCSKQTVQIMYLDI